MIELAVLLKGLCHSRSHTCVYNSFKSDDDRLKYFTYLVRMQVQNYVQEITCWDGLIERFQLTIYQVRTDLNVWIIVIKYWIQMTDGSGRHGRFWIGSRTCNNLMTWGASVPVFYDRSSIVTRVGHILISILRRNALYFLDIRSMPIRIFRHCWEPYDLLAQSAWFYHTTDIGSVVVLVTPSSAGEVDTWVPIPCNMFRLD